MDPTSVGVSRAARWAEGGEHHGEGAGANCGGLRHLGAAMGRSVGPSELR